MVWNSAVGEYENLKVMIMGWSSHKLAFISTKKETNVFIYTIALDNTHTLEVSA